MNANLEKVSVKHSEKEKLIEEIRNNKKDLVKVLENINSSVQNKEGFLYVKVKDSNEYFKKRYFKIHNSDLIYFKLKKGTDQIDLSKNYTLCNLLLSNVKKTEKDYDYPFCFEIISVNHKKTFLMQAEVEKESEEWQCSIRNAIAQSISQYKDDGSQATATENIGNVSFLDYSDCSKDDSKKDALIEKLITTSKCSDCDSENPTWCSINWLCMICIDCSGVHRSLGVQISKIRSLRLDNLEQELIELLDIVSGEKINKILEANVKSYEKPKPNSMFNEKEVYIINKYKLKKYLKSPIKPRDAVEDNELYYSSCIFKLIEADDIINIYYYLKLGYCDINGIYTVGKEKYSFLHHTAKHGKLNIFRLLVLLGADLQIPDSKGLKPMDYATIFKNVKILFEIDRNC